MADEDGQHPPDAVTGLTPGQRRRLLNHIAAEQRRAAARIAALEGDFDNIVDASADAVRDDEHDPEGATIAFERAQVATLLHDARTLLSALGKAAQRLDSADAGRCARCGQHIPFERLLARPSSARCIACAGRR